MTNKNLLKILFVEDLPSDVDLAVLELRKEKLKFEHTTVCTRADLIKELNEFKPDLIISDYMMPAFNGLQALKEVKEFNPEIPFILCTGSINEETAVECIKAGADDYVIKEHLTRLPFAVKEALEQNLIEKEKKAAELLLKESEEKLQSIFSAAPVGIGLVVERVFMEVNDTFCKMTGYDRKELIGKTSEMVYPTREEYEFVGLEKNRQIAEKGIASVETRLKCRDGRILNIISCSTPLDACDHSKGLTFTVLDITERKGAEEALRESEEKWRTLVTTIPEYIGLVDCKGKFLFLNHYAEGFSEKDTIGKSHLDFIPNEWKEFYRQKFERCISTQKNQIFEYTAFGDNKTLRTYETFLVPIIQQGKVSNVMAIARDITERKQAEDKLRNSEERLKILFEYAPDAYYLNDLKGNFIDGNIAAEKLMGYNRNELIGKSFLKLNLLSFKQIPGAAKLLIKNALGQGTGPDEFVLSRKDGSKVTVEIITHPVKIKDKTLVLGLARDISERKLAEYSLQQSYAFSESLLKTIPFGMNIVDETGTVLFQSDNFKNLFGEDAIGKKCWELYRDDKTQSSDCPLLRGITIGETEAYESHGVLGNRIFEINYTGMMYQGKKAMLEIFQDITDRKENENELILAKEKAEESDRLKTAFLHNISHEIRTPMNAIVGFSALLGEPDADAQSRKDYIEVIMQSSNHLLAIISDIVDISNIEANLVKIAKNDVNFNSTLKSIYEQFLPKTSEKKIQLICETNVPDSDAFIITDSTKLTQILINLINNAIKFTDKGYVKVGYVLRDKLLEFHVSDTGIGISEEYHQKIFDRFYQVQHTISRLYEGTGLGLAISKANVELMGGKIWLTSEPGKGTSFYFTIPYEKRIVETLAANERRIAESFVFPVKKKILVAEDIDSNFKLICYFLSGANTDVIRATNGKEAVEKCLSDQSIDLALMDIKMPVMDGYTAVKLIRETNTTIPIIAQSAYVDDREKAIEFGCSGFISKPFDKKSLLSIMGEFI